MTCLEEFLPSAKKVELTLLLYLRDNGKKCSQHSVCHSYVEDGEILVGFHGISCAEMIICCVTYFQGKAWVHCSCARNSLQCEAKIPPGN